ncbi:MAG TPA: DmsE family decaheme c-type cytochrome [Candidatus Acidoferrales bacterium]|nr:DmsE family decaheme c-type cytochrome [Candidatus Acidoferrales bacterium]
MFHWVSSRHTPIVAVLIGGLLALAAGVPGRAQQAAKRPGSQKQTKKYERPTDPALYLGTDTCKTCHEDMPTKGFFKNYEASPHFLTTMDTKRGPEWHGCEACHGPGKEHVEGGGDKSKIFSFKGKSAQEISARCLDCHQFGEEHSNYARSQHLKNNVSCVDCHSPHTPKVQEKLLKAPQPTLCYGCHLEVKGEFSKPFHHRVNEGLVACSNCHNPHGGFLTRQLRSTAAQDVVCFTCHTDKAGPFAFEHAPVKTEGCVICHTPHGSSNPRLLKRSQVNLLCLECHTFTVDSAAPAIPTFHNQAQKYQACTMCHIAVHGSNSDRFLFKP